MINTDHPMKPEPKPKPKSLRRQQQKIINLRNDFIKFLRRLGSVSIFIWLRRAGLIVSLVSLIYMWIYGFPLTQQEISFIWHKDPLSHENVDQLRDLMLFGAIGFIAFGLVTLLSLFSKTKKHFFKHEIVLSKLGIIISLTMYLALVFAAKNGFFSGVALFIGAFKGIIEDIKAKPKMREKARQWAVDRAPELLIDELEVFYQHTIKSQNSALDAFHRP